MSKREESKKRLVEFLWAEINRAILKSPDVRSSVKSLQALDLLNYVSDYNLVLDVKTLIEMILKDEEEDFQGLDDSGEFNTEDMVPKILEVPDEKRQATAENAEPLDKPVQNDWMPVEPELSDQRIDGKRLSQKEVEFQDHLQNLFDENEWMKQVGIRFTGE